MARTGWIGCLFLAVWTACFLAGAFNHARDILAGGWMPYRFAPAGFNLFWTLLLPLDLAVVGLLWVRRGNGVLLGVAVLVADVAVNSWVLYGMGHDEMTSALQLQSLFLGFVLGSAPWLLRERRA